MFLGVFSRIYTALCASYLALTGGPLHSDIGTGADRGLVVNAHNTLLNVGERRPVMVYTVCSQHVNQH
jgi:hypothetical protein